MNGLKICDVQVAFILKVMKIISDDFTLLSLNWNTSAIYFLNYMDVYIAVHLMYHERFNNTYIMRAQ